MKLGRLRAARSITLDAKVPTSSGNRSAVGSLASLLQIGSLFSLEGSGENSVSCGILITKEMKNSGIDRSTQVKVLDESNIKNGWKLLNHLDTPKNLLKLSAKIDNGRGDCYG